jgi:hypothetical protein
MMGTSCRFLLTKLSNLLLYYFPFFLYIYNYAVIDSGYREVSSYVGGFDPGGA